MEEDSNRDQSCCSRICKCILSSLSLLFISHSPITFSPRVLPSPSSFLIPPHPLVVFIYLRLTEIWKIGQAMWKREYNHIYAALSVPWGPAYQTLAKTLTGTSLVPFSPPLLLSSSPPLFLPCPILTSASHSLMLSFQNNSATEPLSFSLAPTPQSVSMMPLSY